MQSFMKFCPVVSEEKIFEEIVNDRRQTTDDGRQTTDDDDGRQVMAIAHVASGQVS